MRSRCLGPDDERLVMSVTVPGERSDPGLEVPEGVRRDSGLRRHAETDTDD